MSNTKAVYWGNLPLQNAAPEFLAYLQKHYPDLKKPIETSLALNHDSVGPEIPMNISGTIISMRKVHGIWKVYGPAIPQCKTKSLMNILHSAMSTCLQ